MEVTQNKTDALKVICKFNSTSQQRTFRLSKFTLRNLFFKVWLKNKMKHFTAAKIK